MLNPLFDPAGLSNEDIESKLSDIYRKMIIVNSTSGNVAILDQLMGMRDQLLHERMERMMIEDSKAQKGTALVTGGYPKEEKNGKEKGR